MAAATMYVTPAGAGAKDGTTWATAFGEAEFEADLETNAEAGDIYYVAGGTYTLDTTYDSTARDATTVAPISIIGVNSGTTNEPPVLADWATADNRPLFACGASYSISVGDYYKVFNCRFTGAAASILILGSSGVCYNCKSTNSRTATATATSFSGTTATFISCEGIGSDSTHGYAFACQRMIYCYAHDCNWAVDTIGNGVYLFNILDTATVGFSVVSDDSLTAFGNTIYNCVTAVSATDSYAFIGINNIVDTATYGFLWTTQNNINVYMYNHIGNSVTDMWDLVAEIGNSDLHRDHWVTGPEDPDFTDEAGGNFSLEGTSPCINAGLAMQLGVG